MSEEVAKGVNFVFAKEYIVEKHGESTWNKAVASLPEDHAKVWTGVLVPFGTYSFPAFKEMVHAVAEESGARDDRELARMYEYIADRSLNAVYKIFFKFANPSFVIGNYPKLWSRFFTAGKVTVPKAEKGFAQVHFELPEMFLDWLGPACLGYSNKAVSMSGGRDVVVEEQARRQLPGGDWLGPACLGYSNKAVTMSGGRDVLVEEQMRRRLSGDEWEVDFEIRWSE